MCSVCCVRILLIYDISIQHTSCTSCMHVSVCDITEIILWSSNIPMIVILLVILTCITRRKPNLYNGMPLSLTKWSAVCKAHSYPHSTYKGGVSDKWPTQCQWPSPTLTAHTEPIHGYRQKWHHKLKVSWHIVYRALKALRSDLSTHQKSSCTYVISNVFNLIHCMECLSKCFLESQRPFECFSLFAKCYTFKTRLEWLSQSQYHEFSLLN